MKIKKIKIESNTSLLIAYLKDLTVVNEEGQNVGTLKEILEDLVGDQVTITLEAREGI